MAPFTEPARFVIPDLTGQAAWTVTPTADDDRWLSSIAELPAETYLLRPTGDLSPHPPESEPILYRDLEGWRAGRYIGELRHQGRVLEIRPRLGIDTVAEWISTVYNVHVLPRAAGPGQQSTPVIIQLVAAVWRAAILDAGRHALPRTKRQRKHTGFQIKGRLSVPLTAHRRAQGHSDAVSISTVRSLDNAATATIVLADRLLDRHIANPHWRGPRIDTQLAAFRQDIGPRPNLPTLSELHRVRYTPITLKWKRAAGLSHLIATNQMLRRAPTAETTHGLLLDVAELWELFVLHCVSRATTLPVDHGTRADRTDYLLTSASAPASGLGRLFPDVLIGQDTAHPHQEASAIIDAKYKPLRDPRGVDRDDLYQIFAYAQRFGAAKAMLAYPTIPDQQPAGATRQGPWHADNDAKINFNALPVRSDTCIDALRQWLHPATGHRP